MKKRLLWIMADLLAAAVIVLMVWIVNYKIPQKGIKVDTSQKILEDMNGSTPDRLIPEEEIKSGRLKNTKVIMDSQDWRQKFADKFTETVVATDTSYTSPDLSIQLSYNQYDTGKLDRSNKGKHEKYGTQTSYVIADIYVGDITCL